MEIGKTQTTTGYKKLVIAFSAIAVITLGLIVYYSLSKTVITVTLAPKKVTSTFTVDVRADPATAGTSPNSALTGYLIATDVSGSKDFQNTSSGGTTIAAQATGTVTIYNNWSQAQALAATTRLLTPDGILFRLKDRVDVPAGGKIENVAVYADQAGATGNISPTKFTIPGLWPGLQEKIYAESTTAMTGGTRQAHAITQTMINDAQKTVEKELVQQAATALAQTEAIKNSQDAVLPQAIRLITAKETSSAKADEEADIFTYSVNAQAVAVIFKEAELENLAIKSLQSELPVDEQINQSSRGTLRYSLETYDVDKQTATLQVSYTTTTIPRLSNTMFNRDNTVGKDRQTIQEYFSNFDTVKNVSITFSPFWVTRAPRLKDHIEIKLQQ